MPADYRTINEKKFMWNGIQFPSKNAILDIMQKFKKDGSEIKTVVELRVI